MTIRISCGQLDCTTLDTDANLAKAEMAVRTGVSQGSDLILLPEYTATGLLFDRRILNHAAPIDSGASEQFREWSGRYGCWIGAGIVERDGDRFYNTLALFSPSGQYWNYRKRYLAFFENLSFRRGHEIGIVHTDLGRVGLMICWDMIHSRLVREMRDNVDLLLIASAWPDLTTGSIPLPGIQSWLSKPPRTQPSILAKQLGVPVAYCNMGGRFTTELPGIGMTYESAMAGKSAILDADGRALQLADHGESSLLTADVDVTSAIEDLVAA